MLIDLANQALKKQDFPPQSFIGDMPFLLKGLGKPMCELSEASEVLKPNMPLARSRSHLFHFIHPFLKAAQVGGKIPDVRALNWYCSYGEISSGAQ